MLIIRICIVTAALLLGPSHASASGVLEHGGTDRFMIADASPDLVREALRGACASDAARLCARVQRVGIRILGCLVTRAPDLSPACHDALKRSGIALDQ